MSDDNKESIQKPPKSQIKREMQLLQKMGETLISLSGSELAKIPLTDPLKEAIEFAKTLKNDESRRRHLQYIGKIMREVETQPIKQALEKIRYVKDENTKLLHKVEEWRAAFLTEGDVALQRFYELYPIVDKQQLRQLIRKAQQEKIKNQNLGTGTKLFRYIKEILMLDKNT